jgi:IS30 family transposase
VDEEVHMARTGRPGLSREKRIELWERWKAGECASDIARELARTKGAIHHVLAFNGGIAPVARRRGSMALVLEEREEISRGIAVGRSIRRIAASLGRSPSTVSREVTRHGGRSS